MGRMKFDFNKSKNEAKQELNGGNGDDRFWTLSDIKNRKSYTMRLIPSNDGTGSEMYTKIFTHNFEYIDQNGKKRKYFGTCPKTYGKECPICQSIYERNLWNGDEDDKALARKYGKKKKYLTNVLIVSDEIKPDLNGTIKMIKMSPQAFEKILKQISPDKADSQKRSFVEFHPYDIYNAADFYLDFTPAQNGKFPNWSESEFDRELYSIGKTDEEAEELFNTGYNIQEYVNELMEKALSPEEILEKIGHVLAGEELVSIDNDDDDDDDNDYVEPEKKVEKKVVKEEKVEKVKEVVKEEKIEEIDDDEFDDDDFSDFE